MAGKKDANDAYKEVKALFEDLKKCRKQERKKTTLLTTMTSRPDSRVCSRCNTEKPLDKDHYQVVRYFQTGFSYYCNECNKPKPRQTNGNR